MPSLNRTYRLGAVSYLNSRPLIDPLRGRDDVVLREAVPAQLAALLQANEVDVALMPVIDLIRSNGVWQRVSTACIGSDGPTFTVGVFSRVPPEKISTLYVDTHSHTSVVLVQVLWRLQYDRPLTLIPIDAANGLEHCEAVLLIGDKVVTTPVDGFSYNVDLGEAWKQCTGLPFVFAVWAAPANGNWAELGTLLDHARDQGLERAAEIAKRCAPAHHWPVELAHEYMTRILMYRLTPPALRGIEQFIELATRYHLIQPGGTGNDR